MTKKEKTEIKIDVIDYSNKININWYPGHMAKAKRLIRENKDLIDIVYEVVDARMPYSSKIRDMDDFLENKPRVLVMTKSDLCDKKETEKWIKYYEKNGYKVVLVDLEHTFNPTKILNMTTNLMQEFDEKREAKGLSKRKYRILIVGIPNVGKSTLINRLVGKKAVNVGNKPGVTKELNWIRINDTLELLDTPGILWPKIDEGEIAYNLASFTAIKEEILPLYEVVEYILKKLEQYYPKQLEERYGITSVDEDIIVTLEEIGRRRGCVIRGGEIDYDRAVNVVLNDIKGGLIKNITFDRVEELTSQNG